jgi:hypothetical protein
MAPPAGPADGARYIVASGATGAWSGWDLNVAYWVDGAWMRLVPRTAWQAWVADEATFLAWTGSAWVSAGLPAFFSDAVFELAHDGDPTRRAVFDLAAIAAGATRRQTWSPPTRSGPLLTHAHIDHSGLLTKLARQGSRACVRSQPI